MVLVSRIEKSWSTFKVAFFILSLLVIPLLGQAAGPSTLVDIPQVNSANGINGYIEALYTLAITAASLIAIIQLIKAGSKYVFSAVVTDKGEAKKDIRNALIGLLIIIGAVTILNEINPQLTNLNILGNATQLTNPGGSNVPDLSIPDYLKPSSNQNLSLIKCSGQKNDVGELDCSAAIQKCLNQNGTTRNNKVMSGNLLCYTNVQTCNITNCHS